MLRERNLSFAWIGLIVPFFKPSLIILNIRDLYLRLLINIESSIIPWKLMPLLNSDIFRELLDTKSNFPISKNRPFWARHRIEAINFSSANEFNTMSTPRPFVCCIIICSKLVSREFPIWSSKIVGNIFLIKSRLSLVPTVVNISHPTLRARWIAACPMPPVPECISTLLPFFIFPKT